MMLFMICFVRQCSGVWMLIFCWWSSSFFIHIFFALRFDAFHGVYIYKLSWSLLDDVKIEPEIKVWHLSIWWSSRHDCGTYDKKLWYKLLKRCPTYGKNHTTLGRHKFSRPLRFLDFWPRPSVSFRNLESTSVLKIYLYRPHAVGIIYYHMPGHLSTLARDSGISFLPADVYNGRQCGITFRP